MRCSVITDCGHHLLCELIGGPCHLATRRTRGCRPNLRPREIAPALLDEVRELLGAIDPAVRDEATRALAIRLAAIARTEALDDRNLLATVASDEPDLAPALARLCRRRT